MQFSSTRYYSAVIILIFLTTVQAAASDTLYPELKDSFDVSGLGADPDIAVTEEGEVYIISSAKPGLWHLQKKQRIFAPVYIKGVPKDYFFSPSSVESGKDGELWIANPHMHEILVCSSTGEVLRKFDRENAGLEWPHFLFRSADGKIGAWDKRQKKIFIFDPVENKVISKKLTVNSSFTCMQDAGGNTLCFDTDNGRVIKISGENAVTEAFPKSGTPQIYPKIHHMENGPGNSLFYTDSKHMAYVSADLEPLGRFLLYEHLFIRLSRFTFQGDHLWLMDEGRQELMHFLVKKAETALEHLLLGEEYLALGHFAPALEEILKAESLGQKGAETDMATGKAYY
ncbi:MAG: hypothetical protein V2I97_24850, partial [Desulfococcaceae bacterium]|nr:hypothetical protein [Desulfococcaceae bacterium]